MTADGFHQATHGGVRTSSPGLEVSRGDFTWYVIMDLKITPLGQTIVKPTALGPVANTDTKLLIYGLFQKGRVLAQDGIAPVRRGHPAYPYMRDADGDGVVCER